ncbi:hypothetical protein AL036_14395 [Salipiger aestuarii]|nr:hypothetical protein AL036_14395 [Salipiger aestuarii]
MFRETKEVVAGECYRPIEGAEVARLIADASMMVDCDPLRAELDAAFGVGKAADHLIQVREMPVDWMGWLIHRTFGDLDSLLGILPILRVSLAYERVGIPTAIADEERASGKRTGEPRQPLLADDV